MIKITFFETFAGVFVAQALAWFCGWLIKKYAEPHFERVHADAGVKFSNAYKRAYKLFKR